MFDAVREWREAQHRDGRVGRVGIFGVDAGLGSAQLVGVGECGRIEVGAGL